MVSSLKAMNKWNNKLENEIMVFVKDWLRQKGKTQKDLCKILNTSSERMPAIIEIIKTNFSLGGIPKVASLLCKVDQQWVDNNENNSPQEKASDPFSQLDLLLEEINEDCNN